MPQLNDEFECSQLTQEVEKFENEIHTNSSSASQNSNENVAPCPQIPIENETEENMEIDSTQNPLC